MKNALIATALASTLAACASSPASIAPVPMTGAYNATSCSAARDLLANERVRLANLESQQNSAVAGDAISVILIGLPLASIAGAEVESELAISKGRVLELENRLARC